MVGKANPNRAVKEAKVRGSNPLGVLQRFPLRFCSALDSLNIVIPINSVGGQEHAGWWATWWAKLSRSFPPTLLRHVECPARSCAHRCRMLSTCANAQLQLRQFHVSRYRCCRPYDGRCEIHTSVCRDQLPHDPSPDRARSLEPN